MAENNYKLNRRHFKGRHTRPLLESEIKRVMEVAINAHDAADKMGVQLCTFKKYATMYGLYKDFLKKSRKSRGYRQQGAYRWTIDQLIEGKAPTYPIPVFKERLIRSGKKQNCCEMCGYKEGRISDGRVPLIINFLDGNKRNWALSNCQLVCYNCSWLILGSRCKPGSSRNVLYDVCQWELKDISNIQNWIENPQPVVKQEDTSVEIDINQVDVMSEDDLEAMKREIQEEQNKDKS